MPDKPGPTLSDAIDAYHDAVTAELEAAMRAAAAHVDKTAVREPMIPTTEWKSDDR